MIRLILAALLLAAAPACAEEFAMGHVNANVVGLDWSGSFGSGVIGKNSFVIIDTGG